MLWLNFAFTIPLMLSSAPDAAAPLDELGFSAPAEPDASGSYECVTGGEEEEEEEPFPDIYCLARCSGFDPDEYRATHSRPVKPIEKGDDWCKSRARTYCHTYNLDFEDWCWGERSE